MRRFDFLPNDKSLAWFKLKSFADDTSNVAQKAEYVHYREEKIVGKGENAGYKHFLLFARFFPKPSSIGSLKSGLCSKELKQNFFI